MIVLDGGTTWAKIIEKDTCFMQEFKNYFIKENEGFKYYIMPSQNLKDIKFKFDKGAGHMVLNLLIDKKDYENEVIALVKGFRRRIKDENAVVLDMGSRDIKRALFKNGSFKDLDWNNSCSSSTGASAEMLLKFYNLKVSDLKFTHEKYIITCGIFGFEKIMDDISKGAPPENAVSKFVHGIAYNAWEFAKKPEKLYLSGGFCENQCFIDSLNHYCTAVPLGRFLPSEGLTADLI